MATSKHRVPPSYWPIGYIGYFMLAMGFIFLNHGHGMMSSLVMFVGAWVLD